MIIVFALIFGICIFQAADFWNTYKIANRRGGDSALQAKRLTFKNDGIRAGRFISKLFLLAFVLTGAWLEWFDSAAGFAFICILFMIYAIGVSRNPNVFKKQLVYRVIGE